MLHPPIRPVSEHFNYLSLADGVWAAIARPGGLAASNAGIIGLGDQTLIFDTTFSPASALDLQKNAQFLTGHPVTAVLNSHWHNDHVFGNSVFSPDTNIYATEQTSKIMAEKTEKEITDFKLYWPTQQAEWAERSRSATDETQQQEHIESVQFAQSVIDTFPQLSLRLPTRTFTNRVEFKGTYRTAELITLGGGHTASDAILYLPAERIVFMGDLLVIKNHPDLTHGDPRTWLDILEKVKALGPGRLIPGHGKPGTVKEITTLQRYIKDLLQLVEHERLTGKRVDTSQPPAYTARWDNAEAYEKNLEFVRGLP
jgi:glyoxylase-like metal-dependent hydrolase (beta-lactamase superfamily II)